MKQNTITNFIETNFRHFNSLVLLQAARAYKKLIESGGKMMITLAGAMSTGELGVSLAEMIRQGKVHIITCTGANLEEDFFNLVGRKDYKDLSHYRDLRPEDEEELLEGAFNRVTDSAIPEHVFRKIEHLMIPFWQKAQAEGKSYFPHEYFYQLAKTGQLKQHYHIDPKDSWLLAAYEKNLPIIVPGWEDSTLGNVFAAYCVKGMLKPSIIKNGIEYMIHLADWYMKNSGGMGVGFFQIGGGIAGDFPICVVPMIKQDMKQEAPFWSYFCQISDSTTSYGSYSGAIPNEKITWEKIGIRTPRFVIESDASIVAPLIFAYVLGW